MRILHIETINSVGRTYATALDARGHVSTVFEPSLVGAGATPVIKMAMMAQRMWDLRRLVGMLDQEHFDVMHIHWASYGVLGLASRIPFVVHCHGSDVRHRLESPLFRQVLAPILRRAASVLCISPDLVPIVQSVRPDALFFPGAIDTMHFVPAPDGPGRPWTILLLARLDPMKGSLVATRGIEQFVQRHPDVRVMVPDWGPLRGELRYRYGAQFEFVPPVPQAAVRELIWRADVVVGQFALGAIGLAELQAMSCAKPVIAAFRYPEAYPTPPPLRNAATAQEIDASLEHCYRHPKESAALSRAAREWVVHHHDSHALAARLEQHYESIIEGSASRDSSREWAG